MAGCIDSESYVVVVVVVIVVVIIIIIIIIIIITTMLVCFLKNLVLEEQIQRISFHNVTSELYIIIKFVSVDLQTVFLT